MNPQNFVTRARRKWIKYTFLTLLVIAASFFVPWNVYSLSSHPRPAQSYEEAVQRIEILKANRLTEMHPDCVAQFLTHGQRVDKVIILVHGYTNCPKEFVDLGKQFYDLGYNVLIAPLPHHGLKDRLNDEQGELNANELAAYTDGWWILHVDWGAILRSWVIPAAASLRPGLHRTAVTWIQQ